MANTPKPLPPQADLHRLFIYVYTTGELIWRTGRNRWKVAGTKTYNSDGSPRAIRVKLGDGNQESAIVSRVIWKWVTGKEPSATIDHADVNPHNNAWTNLREANVSEQNANKRQFSATGLKGAYPKDNGRFYSHITKNGKVHHLGVFDTPEEAHEAYMSAANEVHGQFARAT